MGIKNNAKIRFKKGPCELDFFHALPRMDRVWFHTKFVKNRNTESAAVCIAGIKWGQAYDNESLGKIWNFTGLLDGEFRNYRHHSHIEGEIDFSKGGKGWIKIID